MFQRDIRNEEPQEEDDEEEEDVAVIVNKGKKHNNIQLDKDEFTMRYKDPEDSFQPMLTPMKEAPMARLKKYQKPQKLVDRKSSN